MSTATEPQPLRVPEGFFDEIELQLASESAEEISDAVIGTCISRGILHPELDYEPDDNLRAEELREVFYLLDEVTAAVADGSIVPRRLRYADQMDPRMERQWDRYTDDAIDPEATRAHHKLAHPQAHVSADSAPDDDTSA
ncbi:Uncharacterised protein (plasmid) [Tsukamurella tyrosinosolvens]|uniref:Uncharacterized protein n=1 Tax=Tsukamurella tyrosinosolvens TaxID=57704 RepID=A0A1H4VS57_TSUTY|nr:hypothetical protein [Tsukamurella tyrosinosolvens]KXO90900.1 hypothetical protein AXK58_20930 [Tsukamurella tyrosinosolvens]SEC83710.1 hypothetical protein SAMN04489793_3316 [Tsukamurella tyrosinosolvens]VEH90338.1 Uncharacterised protein [Tsukamurella tyrosinosolvens]